MKKLTLAIALLCAASIWSDAFAATTTPTVNSVTQPKNGGTGVASPTAHSIMLGEGSSAMTPLGCSSTGQVLTSNGPNADPSCQPANANVVALSYTSTAGASANTTAIQAALTAGGTVSISCPSSTPTFYTNAPVNITSRTNLNLGTCHWILANNTNLPMIENLAYASPWTYLTAGATNITWHVTPSGAAGNGGNGLAAELHWVSHPLVVGDWVQLEAAPDSPSWAPLTTYGTGFNAINGGNKYTVATAGISASSGGPTGTGSGITDGTVVWNYVAGFGGTASNFWSGTTTAASQGGPSDTAYFGVFPVVQVVDANNVNIILRRQPAAAFTGIPVGVKKADHDIIISGNNALLDYNGVNQSGTGSQPGRVAMMLSGVARSEFKGFSILNPNLWSIALEGGSQILVDHYDLSPQSTINPPNGTSNFISYGCMDCTVQYSAGPALDDNVVFAASNCEVVPHPDDLSWSGSDVLGVHVSYEQNIGGFNNTALWGLHNSFIIDDVTFDHLTGHESNTGFPAVRIQNPTSTCAASAGSAAVMGTIRISDSEMRDQNAAFVQTTTGGNAINITVNKLILDNIDLVSNSSQQWINFVPPGGATYTFNEIDIKNSLAASTTLPTLAVLGSNTTGTGGTLIVPYVSMTNNTILSSTSSTGAFVLAVGSNGSTTSGRVDIQNNYINNMSLVRNNSSLLNVSNNYIAGVPNLGYLIANRKAGTINLINNYIPTDTTTVVDDFGPVATIFAASNYMPSATQGIERCEVNLSPVITGGGGNNFNNTWTSNGSGTCTTTNYGFDVSAVGSLNAVTGTFSATVKTAGYTVSGLPAGSVGMRAYVTDQLTACAASGAALTGGGAVTCAVFYNGSAWVGD